MGADGGISWMPLQPGASIERLNEHLVQTPPERGVTHEDANAAIRLLLPR